MDSETKSPTPPELARTKSGARTRAKKIVDQWTVGLAATGWLPGAGIFSAATDQVMIRQVAECFGVAAGPEAKSHIAALVGSGLVGGASEAAFAFIPGVGWLVKGILLTAKARLIGEATIKYFESKSTLPE
jgi:hypothetical protein